MTNRRGFLGATALLCTSWAPYVPDSHALDRRPFQCFDATLFIGKPSQSAPGITRMPVVYEASIWGADGRTLILPPSDQMLKKIGEVVGSSPFAVLDIERYPDKSKEEVALMIQALRRILVAARASSPKTQFGFYSLMPKRDYWRALKGLGSEPYATWQKENDLIADLAREVDFLAPSLYTFFDDDQAWRSYASAQIAEARRIAANRPIFPFIWPRFHESNKNLGNKYLSDGMWRAQLAFCKEKADGAIIWGGWKETWSDRAEWWLAAEALCKNMTGDGG